MRYLGIDYGTKKIGLALSDESGHMGFPHAVVPTTDIAASLRALIPGKEVGVVVIGESKDFAGNDNPVAADAKQFGAWIGEEFKLPVHWEPELFTTAEARRAQEPEPKSRAPRDRSPVDASAAALILTSYLSRPHGTN